ncbi:transaldolase family protein [Oceanobacillus sp. CFH 90083]|uniref:transaldolase family protein n=1 Tax=Oceanobacillus sp. CFH 90083 TaxID=2592336 RepID=UPI00128C68FA|nr:transaldolase family protein [Oceanobacillus sp. CFH 90083]
MKIFLDTANLSEIKNALDDGLISGLTTNPTLVAKEGKDYQETVDSILNITNIPTSIEVVSDNFEQMVEESIKYAALSPQVVIKIPCSRDGLKLVRVLSKKEIKTNVTLVYTANQAFLSGIAGATYISPFINRLKQISTDGINNIEKISSVFAKHSVDTKILAASIRDSYQVTEAFLAGADIVTLPYSIYTELLSHPLTETGITTFREDYEKVVGVEG